MTEEVLEEMDEEGRSRGGQLGNQNARKHGFYSRVLDEKEQREYERAIEIEGLDEEIAMLRVKIMSVLEKDPDNVRLITQAINSLVRMVVLKSRMESGDEKDIAATVKNIIKHLAIPAGITIASHMMK